MQPFGHEMLSWVRLRDINAHSVSPPARYASWYQFLLLGELGHHVLVACPDRAISQKVGSLGYRTGDPLIPGQILNHTTTGPLTGTLAGNWWILCFK